MNDDHLSLETLADYFAEALDDDAEEAVELHLADCDRCAASARWLHSRPQPDLDAWTARSHGEAAVRAGVADSLGRAAKEHPDFAERLQNWCADFAREALHLVRGASGKIADGLVVLAPPPDSLRSRQGWQFQTVPSFRQDDDLMTPAPAEAPTLRVTQRGIGYQVRVEGIESTDPPRLVALIPLREDEPPKIRPLKESRTEKGVFLASFQHDDDDFVVALEPWCAAHEQSS